MSLDVIVIGAGIGGLCLAQGLRKSGVHVSVYERDAFETARPQGYRIHINPDGSRALHDCLPKELFEVFLATSGTSGGGIRFLTEQMKTLLYVDFSDVETVPDLVESHRSVNRMTLRQILSSGLDSAVHFGKTFSHYAFDNDGRITAYFHDGTYVTGDVLIGADGGKSVVRRQYLPHAKRVDMGVVNIMGKYPLTKTKSGLPPEMLSGISSVMAPHGVSMFVAAQEFQHDAMDIAKYQVDTNDFVMWVFSARREKFAFNPSFVKGDGTILQSTVLAMTKNWHPAFHKLIQETAPANIACTTVKSAVPIPPWKSRNITLLGDAIHSMTPARGIGANVALRDASLLCKNLVAVQNGTKSLLQAINDYETQMIQYGFDAVRTSKKAQEQAVADNRFASIMVKTAFRVIDKIPRLKRKLFNAFGEG